MAEIDIADTFYKYC